ncbi:MAG: RelA/SpoT family protein [Patescibacteria group bacterium]|nr:RelA/SpoT family protein [Patescibacteria group bacterium]MCL5431476.1 RelA/SpoT family protein [Patescibacteria group bacterium]
MTDLYKKALSFAQTAHTGQKRASGQPYITHLEATAQILAQWHMDDYSVAAGLLHDSIEDGAATNEDLIKEFGPTIAALVDGVTKVGEIRLRGSTEEEFVENLRKMFLAMAQDLRVVIIKLADRLHNMRTLQYLPEHKRARIARETMEVYAPLADRLGMGEVKGELEDLAFPYLYPQDYQWLKDYSAPAYKEAQKHILEAKRKLLAEMAKEKLKPEIAGRAKHIYSLYRKLLRPEINKDISLIHDLVALRVLVDTVEQCYTALGAVHKIYKPVPSLGVSDYIALPKPNGYRSIHTKVFGPDGRIIEVQIRTHAMHEESEYGVAAHFNYAAVKSKSVSGEKLETEAFAAADKLSWVKQLANWQNEVVDNQEFMQGLKFDALSHRIFVLTPNGDVKDLPAGATPIDFAYAVHSEMGDRATGAKVNGKIVPFDYQLKSGDVCEVLLTKEPRKPKIDWLKFVATHLAKQEIQKGLRTPA